MTAAERTKIAKRPQVVAFDMEHRGERIGTAWARISDDGPGCEIDCRLQVFDNAAGVTKQRRQSRYRFDRSGALVSASLRDHLGNVIEIVVGRRRISFGRQERPLEAPVDFVVESNQIALAVAQLMRRDEFSPEPIRALLPETGVQLGYQVKTAGRRLADNLGQVFEFAGDGEIERVRIAGSDVMFRRRVSKFPRWTLDRRARGFVYSPPGDVRISELHKDRGKPPAPLGQATLVRPGADRDTVALALFIGGTGVYDRHGFTASYDIGYHQLLDGLASLGVASIRYEKFAADAANLVEAEESLGFTELCDNASDWLAWIVRQHRWRSTPKIVIGHSFGGLVALELARRAPQVELAVLLNTPGRSFRDVTETQFSWLLSSSAPTAQSGRGMRRLRDDFINALERGDRSEPGSMGQIAAAGRKMKLYREVLDLDPASLVKAGPGRPVVIVQGTADVQVGVEDARRLASACEQAGRSCALMIEEGLDHLLKRTDKSGLAALKLYRDRRRRVPKAFLRRLAKAIARNV